MLVQTRRNKRAALRLMRKLLKKYGFRPADKLVTDEPEHLMPPQRSRQDCWSRVPRL